MALGEAGRVVQVEVLWVPAPHDVRRVALSLPEGSTAAEALGASGLLAAYPALASGPMGVWGRACEPDQVLRDRDRVECYRPLTVDPKEARRLRHRRAPVAKPASRGAGAR